MAARVAAMAARAAAAAVRAVAGQEHYIVVKVAVKQPPKWRTSSALVALALATAVAARAPLASDSEQQRRQGMRSSGDKCRSGGKSSSGGMSTGLNGAL